MRLALKAAVGVFCLCCFGLSGEALAKTKRPAQSATAAAAAGGSDYQLALPSNLKSNKDFLDVGDEVPVGTTDRYMVEQEDFADQDPLRYTQMGTILDSVY